MRLENKVAIVTGGASGFGKGIVARFLEEGAKVVIADMNADLGQTVASNLGASFVTCDVTDSAAVEAAVTHATSTYGKLDIMVNNAGMPQINGPMLEVDEETFDKIFAVNVKSIYLAARHAVPAMIANGGGAFLNTASTAGLRPRPGLAWYNGSKGAAITLTKSMAVELAPQKIRVNALCPVAGDTPMLDAFLGKNPYEAFVATVPLGRLSTPLDIANAALYLCSDEANFITGVCMEVDGGRCI